MPEKSYCIVAVIAMVVIWTSTNFRSFQKSDNLTCFMGIVFAGGVSGSIVIYAAHISSSLKRRNEGNEYLLPTTASGGSILGLSPVDNFRILKKALGIIGRGYKRHAAPAPVVSKAQVKKNRALIALDASIARSNRKEELSVSFVEPLPPQDMNSNSFAGIFPTHPKYIIIDV